MTIKSFTAYLVVRDENGRPLGYVAQTIRAENYADALAASRVLYGVQVEKVELQPTLGEVLAQAFGPPEEQGH